MVDTLSAEEVILKAYEKLTEKSNKRIEFGKTCPVSLIADDSGERRTRHGYMRYERAHLIDGSRWMIARGTAWGSYPADPYNSDIMVIEIHGKKKKEELHMMISSSYYFVNSPIVAMSDGKFMCAKRSRGEKLFRSLNLREYIAVPADYSDEYILASSLRPLVTKMQRYNPDLPGVLAAKIELLLHDA